MDTTAERVSTILLVSAVGALATTALVAPRLASQLDAAYQQALDQNPDLASRLAGSEVRFSAQHASVTLADESQRQAVESILETLPVASSEFTVTTSP